MLRNQINIASKLDLWKKITSKEEWIVLSYYLYQKKDCKKKLYKYVAFSGGQNDWIELNMGEVGDLCIY